MPTYCLFAVFDQTFPIQSNIYLCSWIEYLSIKNELRFVILPIQASLTFTDVYQLKLRSWLIKQSQVPCVWFCEDNYQYSRQTSVLILLRQYACMIIIRKSHQTMAFVSCLWILYATHSHLWYLHSQWCMPFRCLGCPWPVILWAQGGICHFNLEMKLMCSALSIAVVNLNLPFKT